MKITRDFRFHMAHRNPEFGGTHKCVGLHGHTCYFTATFWNKVSEGKSVGIPFEHIDKVIKPITDALCHSYFGFHGDPITHLITEGVIPSKLTMIRKNFVFETYSMSSFAESGSPVEFMENVYLPPSAENMALALFNSIRSMGLEDLLELSFKETPKSCLIITPNSFGP